MVDFEQIKADIVAVIRQNGNREITGQVLQDILLAMLEAVETNANSGNLIPESGVTTDKMADDAVTTIKIGNKQVTLGKLGQDVVDAFAQAFSTRNPLSFQTIEGVKTLTIDLSAFYTKSEIDAKGFITKAVSVLDNFYDKDEVDAFIETLNTAITDAVSDEAQAREQAISEEAQERQQAISSEAQARRQAIEDESQARQAVEAEIKRQIAGIVASSDVVDIVGTYEELQDYDTSKLGDNDIIKVLQDSTHDDAPSFYRFKYDTQAFDYVGSEAKGYTQAEADEKFATKAEVDRVHVVIPFVNEYSDQDELAEFFEKVKVVPDNASVTMRNDASSLFVVTKWRYMEDRNQVLVNAFDTNFIHRIVVSYSEGTDSYLCVTTQESLVTETSMADYVTEYVSGEIAIVNEAIAAEAQRATTRENEIAGQIGDIATILDEINGEEI